MMKKILIKVIIIALIVALIVCGSIYMYSKKTTIENNELLLFKGLDDEAFQDYVIENLYVGLNSNFTSDDYVIQNITTTYVSKEYIEELSYNSQDNIFFGFTLNELSEKFNGKKYIFQVDENNETTVSEFQEYQNNYTKMLKNIAVGGGIILACATISTLSGGTTVAVIFAASAKTAAEFAISSMAVTGIVSSAVEYYNTGDVKKSLEKGALDGTESFKWGAVLGSVTGGVSETITQLSAANKLKNMNFIERGARAEARAQTKYGGKSQVSYLNGKEVPSSTPGATRPDIVRVVKGKIEAIEVKNYNLNNQLAQKDLCEELSRQVTDRVNNLPQGSLQRVVLDAQGRNYSKETIKEIISKIKEACSSSYADIPVDIMI